MAVRPPSDVSIRFSLGLALLASVLFWVQVAHPPQAIRCWSAMGAILFLAVSYPTRFWASITGLFGFEIGIVAGLFLGVESRVVWILCGFAGALGLTALEHFRLVTFPLPRRGFRPLEPRVLFREIGLGAFAGSLSATFIRSEIFRFYFLGLLLVGGRMLLDRNRSSD